MLNKLLKYDLKYMLKNMAIFYILSIFFAIITRILFNMNQTIIIDIIGQISVGCMFSMIFSTLLNTVIRSWVRFIDSLYKDESYLTHTLPVTKSELYNSKFIQTLIFFFIGFIIIVLSLFIAYYSKDNWLTLTNNIKTITTGLNMNILSFIIMAIILIFLEVFNMIQCGFFGIILGHKKNNNKIGYSFLFGLISYLLLQIIVLFLLFIYGLFNSNIMDLFTSNVLLDISSFKLLIIFDIIIYLLIIIIMNIICTKKLKEGVNIE